MNELRSMVKQSSHYFLAYVLSMVGGIIAFPIYTRLFTVSEYGYLSLIATAVFFVVAVGKLGMQNSIIRFYEEVKGGGKSISLSTYYSTLFFGPLLIVICLCFVYLIIILFLKNFLKDTNLIKYFFLSVMWSFFLCSNSILKNFLRAEQNTKLYNFLGIASKYASILIGIVLVYFIFRSLMGLYIAFIFTEAVVFFYLVVRLFRRHVISLKHFDSKFFKEAFLYGVSFTGTELTSIILNAGDRFIILYLVNAAAVGLYSAGYDLAMYAMESLTSPLSFAITPIFLKIWTEKGSGDTKVFLEKCLKFFLMAALPCIFAFNYLSRDLIVLLASEKYAVSYAVIPYVSFGVLLFGLTYIFSAGLIIYKKSHVIAFSTILAGVINVVLNFLFIPKLGFVGAALATMLAYLILFIILIKSSFVYLPFSVNLVKISKYLFFSIIMVGFMHLFKSNAIFANILGKALIGIIVYLLLLFTFDVEARRIIKSIFIKHKIRLNFQLP